MTTFCRIHKHEPLVMTLAGIPNHCRRCEAEAQQEIKLSPAWVATVKRIEQQAEA